jgi:hypothetical protein
MRNGHKNLKESKFRENNYLKIKSNLHAYNVTVKVKRRKNLNLQK